MKGKGIPEMKGVIIEGDYNIMIMQLLGPSLEELFNYCKRLFSLKTVLMLAIQMLERIELVQSNHFIHRDMKPDNFLIGHKKPSYINWSTSDWQSGSETRRRANTSRGKKARTSLEQQGTPVSTRTSASSSRDDLEGIGYVLMYFLNANCRGKACPAETKKKSTKNQRQKEKHYRRGAVRGPSVRVREVLYVLQESPVRRQAVNIGSQKTVQTSNEETELRV